jgi:hypothetical protein
MSNNNQTSIINTTGFDPYLVRYGSLFLLIVGTFGNVVSFIIFSKGILRKSSTFRYLALLSLMDLLVLYSGLLDLFLMIENSGKFSLRTLHPITCRLHTFITYWSQHSSSWILSFISVDRAIATNRIKFARKFCTPRSADHVVAIILFLIALLNCHELIFLRLQSPLAYRSDQTTISPNRFSTQESLISYGIDRNTKIPKKHDLFVPDIAINLISSKTETPLQQCVPPRGSNYEYFWDHVSIIFLMTKQSNKKMILIRYGNGLMFVFMQLFHLL